MDAKPFIIHNNHLHLSSTASPGDRVLDCSDLTSPVQCADFDYQATLTSISTLRNGFADMTSTFRFTASAKVNGTVVQCSARTDCHRRSDGKPYTQCYRCCILSVYLNLHDISWEALNPSFFFQIIIVPLLAALDYFLQCCDKKQSRKPIGGKISRL